MYVRMRAYEPVNARTRYHASTAFQVMRGSVLELGDAHVHVRACMCTCVYVCARVCMCVFLRERQCVGVGVRVYEHVRVCERVRVQVRVRMRMCASVRWCLCAFL